MPNIKSAKKRVLTSAKKQAANTVVTSSMKTALKKADKEIKAGNKEEAASKVNLATKRIDKAAACGLVHKNKAARLKSKLDKKKNNME